MSSAPSRGKSGWLYGAWGWLATAAALALLVAMVLLFNNTTQGYLACGITVVLVLWFRALGMQAERRERSARKKMQQYLD